MDSAFLLSLQQLVLGETPLTTSEVREMALRHLASAPFKVGNQRTNEHLFCLYVELHREENGDPPDLCHHEDMRTIFLKAYNEGYRYVLPEVEIPLCEWPTALPPLIAYPMDIIEQFGAVYGYQTARILSDLDNRSND